MSETSKTKRKNSWLLPTILILFLLEVITLPLILFLTYAGRAEAPQHIVTFANKQLTWDEDTVVGENGVAHLNFFERTYQNVNSENEDNVFAPGTELDTTIRLKNSSSDTITYIALAWMIKDCDDLALYGDFHGNGASPISDYHGYLPEGVTVDDLLGDGAVTGSVEGGGIHDFDVDWHWIFERGDEIEPGIYESDYIDTYVGNKAAWDVADDATIGFLIIVEGDEGGITPPPGPGPGPGPKPPKTGTESMLTWGLVLIGISAVVLIFAIIRRVMERRQEKKEQDDLH